MNDKTVPTDLRRMPDGGRPGFIESIPIDTGIAIVRLTTRVPAGTDAEWRAKAQLWLDDCAAKIQRHFRSET